MRRGGAAVVFGMTALLVIAAAVAWREGAGARDQSIQRPSRQAATSVGPEAAVNVPPTLAPVPPWRINFVPTKRRSSPDAPGWTAYEGAPYEPARGYGWLGPVGLVDAFDRDPDGLIRLEGEMLSSARKLGRLELASGHAVHRENQLRVFRIDLPDGRYRVTCASVAAGMPLPVVDLRSFKCRAHDVVFAGPRYGAPLAVKGADLVEGEDVVDVSDGHLRVVVGDPAYAGWTWRHPGPWYRGWDTWLGTWGEHRYAKRWHHKITRVVDPGFHSLRINSLEVHPVASPSPPRSLAFRDVFNRDDGPDVNAGVSETDRWITVPMEPGRGPGIIADLHATSLRLRSGQGRSTIAIVQRKPSPAAGIVRYSTRVSLFTGEGSRNGRGFQEAGLLILAGGERPTELDATFIGIGVDGERPGSRGRIVTRIGNGRDGYRTNVDIPDAVLPFRIAHGEHEIIVEHDVENNILRLIQIDGVDITAHVPAASRVPPASRGRFGIRASMDSRASGVTLQQFYWHYRVEERTHVDRP